MKSYKELVVRLEPYGGKPQWVLYLDGTMPLANGFPTLAAAVRALDFEPEPSPAVRDINSECDTFDRCVQAIARDICPRCNGFKKVSVRSPDLPRDNPFFDRVVSVPCPDCAATGWRKP